jgi:hypothetical protein
MVTVIFDKADFKLKLLGSDKEGYFILIKQNNILRVFHNGKHVYWAL